eukprot:3836935-Pleurochrysis_carterae.AAC.1
MHDDGQILTHSVCISLLIQQQKVVRMTETSTTSTNLACMFDDSSRFPLHPSPDLLARIAKVGGHFFSREAVFE